MRFPTQGQFLELLACIFGGIIIGIAYDITHISGVPKLSKVVTVVVDAVFGLLSAVIFLLITYLADFGEVRLYSVLGFIVGFILERLTIKILVAKAVRAVYNYMAGIYKRLHAKRQIRKKARSEKREARRRIRQAVKLQKYAARKKAEDIRKSEAEIRKKAAELHKKEALRKKELKKTSNNKRKNDRITV